MHFLITCILGIVGVYAMIGLLFALPFVFLGAGRIDPPAGATRFGFKLILLPGAAAFWPLLLRRWIKGSPPPAEHSAHRSIPPS